MLDTLLRSLWYILPAYVANGAPVLFGGGQPIDLGRYWMDKRRIFGDHKTVRGFLSSIFVGSLTGLVQGRAGVGIAQAFGAAIGDLLGSFLKRRIGIPPGKWAPLIDEEAFLMLALLFSSLVELAPLQVWILLVVVTPIIHLLGNFFKSLLFGG